MAWFKKNVTSHVELFHRLKTFELPPEEFPTDDVKWQKSIERSWLAVTCAGNRPRQTTTNQRDQVGFCTVTSSLWNFLLRSHTFSRVLLRLHVIQVLIGYWIICVFYDWLECFLCCWQRINWNNEGTKFQLSFQEVLHHRNTVMIQFSAWGAFHFG